jgi:uncharacterized membrane protein
MEKRKETEGSVLFSEEQRMWDTWIRYLLIVDFSFMTVLVSALTLTDKEASLNEKILVPLGIILLNVLILLLFRSIQLITVITANGIYIRLKPFEKKYRFIAKENIKELKEVKANFFNTGIKIKRGEKSFIIHGNKALEIQTSSYKITLGSNRYNDFITSLQNMIAPVSSNSIIIHYSNSGDL